MNDKPANPENLFMWDQGPYGRAQGPGAQEAAQATGARPVLPPNNIDIDKAYWYFVSEVTDRVVPVVGFSRPPEVGASAEEPKGAPVNNRLAVTTRMPQWNEPNFWAQPWEQCASLCISFYKQRYCILNYKVPDDRILVLTGVSYESLPLPAYSVVRFSLLRDGALLARWEDIKIQTKPNPARNWALGGHFLPIPFLARFDRNETITICAEILGIQNALGDFPQQSSDVANYRMKICGTGWLSTMLYTGDGAPRAVDPGLQMDMNGDLIVSDEMVKLSKKLSEVLEKLQ